MIFGHYNVTASQKPKTKKCQLRKPCHLIVLLDNANASALHDNQIWSYQHSSSLYTGYVHLLDLNLVQQQPNRNRNTTTLSNSLWNVLSCIPLTWYTRFKFLKETIFPRTPIGLLVNATMLVDPQQGDSQPEVDMLWSLNIDISLASPKFDPVTNQMISGCCNMKTLCFLASPWNLPAWFQVSAICLLQELKVDFTCYDHPVVLTVEEQVS